MKKLAFLALSVIVGSISLLQSYAAEEEWITLIDGEQGLDNFDQVGGDTWVAKDGAIEATAGTGTAFLVTKESYGNFILHVEFWVSDDANSGIYMRCQDVAAITDRNCYEANIYDQRPDLSFGTGGIVHIGPVSEPYPKAGGKWNSYDIVLQNEHLMINLNQEQTAHVMDTQFAEGPIALQWAAGTVRFRNMRIQPM